MPANIPIEVVWSFEVVIRKETCRYYLILFWVNNLQMLGAARYMTLKKC